MLFLVVGIWYPGGYFKLMEVGKIYFILMGVDVCLGPLLTFVVYKYDKKGLRFDLSFIALCQLFALLYGASIVFQGRPVFNVLQQHVFKVARASDLSEKALLQATKPEWRHLSFTGPLLVAAVAPTDPKVREEVVFGGGDWYNFPKLYVEYDSQRKVALQNAKSLAGLREISVESSRIVDAFLQKQVRPESDFVYLPIVYGFSNSMTAVLDKSNADIVEIIDIEAP
jgi:hypothetical protein